MLTKTKVDVGTLPTRYIAFDTETTGLFANKDRIIELGAVLFENGRVVDSFSSLLNVHMSIPPQATQVNHITNQMIWSAPEEEEVYEKFFVFLGDALDGKTVICAHNARFDVSFLSSTFDRLGYDGHIRYVDTLTLARKHIKGVANYKQETLARHFGIVNRASHRAVTDAEVCGQLLWEIKKIKDRV